MSRLFALSLVAALLLGALPFQSHQARAQAVDWPTHAFDQLRTGYNPDELALNPATASGLHLLWSTNLGGAVNAQPLVIHDLLIDGVPTETVIAASTNGLITAFQAATGKLIWSDQEQVQKTNCGFYPNAVFGVPDTPVYDRQDNALLFVDGAGLLYEVDAATGANKPGWPIQLVANPGLEYVRSGLNLFNRTVYIGISSYCDEGAYNGALMAVDIDSRQLLASFVPAATGNGGAIWDYGGVAIDASDSALYLATG